MHFLYVDWFGQFKKELLWISVKTEINEKFDFFPSKQIFSFIEEREREQFENEKYENQFEVLNDKFRWIKNEKFEIDVRSFNQNKLKLLNE